MEEILGHRGAGLETCLDRSLCQVTSMGPVKAIRCSSVLNIFVLARDLHGPEPLSGNTHGSCKSCAL